MQKDIQNVLGLNAIELKQKVDEMKETLSKRKSVLNLDEKGGGSSSSHVNPAEKTSGSNFIT
jgi:hypothetical protein